MTDEEKRSEEAEIIRAVGPEDVTMPGYTVSERESEESQGTSESSEESSEASSEAAAEVADTKDETKVAEVVSPHHAVDDHRHSDAAHGDAGHGHGGHEDHLGHTAPMSLLLGVLVALGLLTVLTVAVTAIDLGSEGNFIVAMVIATVKAVLVMGYFMHMFWDSKFNVVAFTSSFLFVLLFLAMTLLDRAEYQPTIDKFETDKKMLM